MCVCVYVYVCVCVCVCVCTRFLSYEKYKSGLKRGGMRENACNLLAGSAAGMTAVVTTYPLDLVRARLAKQQVPTGSPLHAPKRLPLIRFQKVSPYTRALLSLTLTSAQGEELYLCHPSSPNPRRCNRGSWGRRGGAHTILRV